MTNETQEDLSELDGIPLDTTGLTPDDLNDEGGFVSKAGFYHLYVEKIKVERNKTGSVVGCSFKMDVLAGEHPDQVGRILYHRVNFVKKDGDALSEGARKFNARFAEGLGLITKEQAGQNVLPQWSRALHTQCVGEVMHEKANADNGNKDRYKLAFGRVWQCNNEKVKDVPKDNEMLKLIGMGSDQAGAASAPVAADVTF